MVLRNFFMRVAYFTACHARVINISLRPFTAHGCDRAFLQAALYTLCIIIYLVCMYNALVHCKKRRRFETLHNV